MKRKLFLLGALCLSATTYGQYCSGGPIYTGDSNIEDLTLIGESTDINYTGCPGLLGLEDQTNMVADLVAGNTYSVELTYGTCSAYTYASAGTVWIDWNGNFSFDPSEVIGSWTGMPNVTDTYTFTVPMTSVNGLQRMRVTQEEAGGLPLDPCATFNYGSVTDFGITITGGSGCGTPYGLSISDGDATSITFNWQDVLTPANGYIMEYGPIGFTPGSGTYTSTTTNTSMTVSGLSSDELYEFYIRSICGSGDTSLYYGPVMGNTFGQGHYLESNYDCGPGYTDISGVGTRLDITAYDGEEGITLPFSILHHGVEYTDATIGNSGALILGSQSAQISQYNANITQAQGVGFYPLWDIYYADGSGNQGVYVHTTGTAPNRQFIVQWVKRHYYDTGGELEFQLVVEESTSEAYYLYGNTEGNTDYYSNGNYAAIGIVTDSDYEEESYYNSTFLENNSCLHYYYTNCPKVQDLTITTYDVDQIGLTWNAGEANETDWVIEYGETGFTPGGTGSLGTINTTNTYDTITGLTQLTDYDVYVYSSCGTGNLGVPVVLSHQTAPLCANPFGLSLNSAVDSIMPTWNWQSNGSGLLPVNYDIIYVPSGQNMFGPNATVFSTNQSNFADTIPDASLIASGVYEVYIQAECNGGDTSTWVGPMNFVSFIDNDTACYAQELELGTSYILNNSGAQVAAGVSTIAPPASGWNTTTGWGNNSLSYTTWYSFDAPNSGDVRISGVDLNAGTKMAVYSTTNCGDVSQFNLLGANDDGVLFGSTNAPDWTVCGLTPGETYYILHSNQYDWDPSVTFSIRIEELEFEAGTATGILDICIGDTADLYNTITGYETLYGTWYDLASTSQLMSDSLFATSVLAPQVYDFEYRVQLGCAFDSIVGQLEIYPLSQAGDNGSINVCKNEPINLESALTGVAILGGTWYDPSDNEVLSVLPVAEDVPGNYNYDYVVGNGVCPDDTALVVVNVSPSCDYLGLEDLQIEGITVYPNPSSDVLNIQSKGQHQELSAQLIDVNGRVVLNSSEDLKAGNTVTLSVDNLDKGVYILKLYNSTVENSFRVVIQ